MLSTFLSLNLVVRMLASVGRLICTVFQTSLGLLGWIEGDDQLEEGVQRKGEERADNRSFALTACHSITLVLSPSSDKINRSMPVSYCKHFDFHYYSVSHTSASTIELKLTFPVLSPRGDDWTFFICMECLTISWTAHAFTARGAWSKGQQRNGRVVPY